MYSIHQESSVRLDPRLYVFPIVLVLALGGFAVRLWYLQVAIADDLVEKGVRMHSTTVETLAPRGLITDRNGYPLAKIVSRTIITAIPRVIRKDPSILVRLAAYLNVMPESLQSELDKGNFRPAVPTPIYDYATVEQATKIVEDASLVGIDVTQEPMRQYPDGTNYAHILGYVRAPSEDDVKRLTAQEIEAAEFVGKQGLERYHERDLMGTPGSIEVEVDRSNRPVRTIGVENPIPGKQLVLGLDHLLQKFAWNELAGRPGSVVALDTQTGEVLCMVSNPTYDLNLFAGGMTQSEFESLLNDPLTPLVNRAVGTPTAPGSTFKIVTTLAAMASGKFSPSWTAYCDHGTTVGKKKIACTGTHGAVSFARAMQKSCNAYFIRLGLKVGINDLGKIAHQCGLGEHADIDTSGESAGLAPNEAYIAKREARGPQWGWFDGHTANVSIGQGELSATPLQMANVALLVANRGIQYRPHFVHATVDANGNTLPIAPEVMNQITLPDNDWDMLIHALGTVIQPGGTASKAFVPGLSWGGKTGSAERPGAHGQKKTTDSWFVGFAPLDHPRIAICVRVEHAGHGGDVAAPIAARVVSHYLKLDRSDPSNSFRTASNH